MTMKPLLLMLCLLAPSLLHAQVKGESGGVYVAGDGFDFEQAAADALRDRTAAAGRLFVVVLERDLFKLTKQRAVPETLSLMQSLASANVAVYVCEQDMRAQRLVHGDLLDRVRVERGWTKAEAQADVGDRKAPTDGTPEGQLRRIRRACDEN